MRFTGKMVAHEYLLDNLLIDEEKRNKALESLATIKKRSIHTDYWMSETKLIREVVIDCFIARTYGRCPCLTNQLDVPGQPGK